MLAKRILVKLNDLIGAESVELLEPLMRAEEEVESNVLNDPNATEQDEYWIPVTVYKRGEK